MADYVRGDGELRIEGKVSAEDMGELIAQGSWLLGSGPAELTLNLEAMTPDDSSFIGAVARLGAEARAASKTLVIRAQGRAADMLSWAGLHRVVTLHISPEPVSA
jgi:hypothetical protein